MKTFISASIAAILLLSGITMYIFHLGKTTQVFCDNLELIYSVSKAEDWEQCLSLINKTEQIWLSKKTVLCAFTDHEELDEIEKTLSKLKESIMHQDKKDTRSYTSVLRILFKRLNENELPTWENILKHTPRNNEFHRML